MTFNDALMVFDENMVFDGDPSLLATLRDFPWHEVSIRDDLGERLIWERTDTLPGGQVAVFFSRKVPVNV